MRSSVACFACPERTPPHQQSLSPTLEAPSQERSRTDSKTAMPRLKIIGASTTGKIYHWLIIGRSDRDAEDFVRYLLEGSGAEDKVDYAALRQELENTPSRSIIKDSMSERSALSFQGREC